MYMDHSAAFELEDNTLSSLPENLFPAVLAYERQAVNYGLFMLHEVCTRMMMPRVLYVKRVRPTLADGLEARQKQDFHTFWPEPFL
jgi:hypothetical protein